MEGTISPEAFTRSPEDSVKNILGSFDDPTREGLLETPKRYVKFLREFTSPPEFKFTVFDAEGYNQMIIQTEIPFYSLCEHHLAPFFGHGSIAYIPNGKIVGLSKLARVLDKFARRLQNQERITKQIAEFLMRELQPQGVAVLLKAQHLCMAMRGVEKPGTMTTTSEMTGVFLNDQSCKNEFLQLIR